MKTLIIQNGVVVNVGAGVPENPASEGYKYVIVSDEAYVGPGWTVNEDGTFTAPPAPPEIFLE
jgi:hypothetical protein